MIVGEYIKQLRIASGLTQEELGKLLGVKRAAVNKWESGMVQNLKRTTIQKLADVFQVSPASFIDGLPTDDESLILVNNSQQGDNNLTSQEKTLLSNYRQLNPDGQKKVDDYVEDLVKGGIYSNSETKDIAAYGGAETVTVNKKELNEAVEKLLKEKGLI